MGSPCLDLFESTLITLSRDAAVINRAFWSNTKERMAALPKPSVLVTQALVSEESVHGSLLEREILSLEVTITSLG